MATVRVSFLPRNPLRRPRPCVPTPIKPRVNRLFGFTSAAQMCDGKMNGAVAATAVVRRKFRREKRMRFGISILQTRGGGVSWKKFFAMNEEEAGAPMQLPIDGVLDLH